MAGIGDVVWAGFDKAICRKAIDGLGKKNSVLLNALIDKGRRKGNKILAPVHVEVIVQYLEEP